MRPAALLLIALSGVLALASCADGDDDPPPAPDTVFLAADGRFADRALRLANDVLAGFGLEAVLAPEGEAPHLTVGSSGNAEAVPFVTDRWVVAVAHASPVLGYGMAELEQILAGSGSVSEVLVPPQAGPALRAWWPDITARTAPLSLDEIPAALNANPDAIAFLPLEVIDARVRSLPIDDVSVVFDRGAGERYPLVQQGWVSSKVHENPDFALVLQQTKTALAERLSQDFAPPDPTILRATGDIIPARCVYAKHLEHGDMAHAFRELGPWLSEADITVGSLDASISDAGRPFECVETFSLLAPAASVEGLSLSGFDVITVATNHVKDCGMDACGDQAFFDTLDILRANGIAPVGGGADLAEARAPAVIEARGTAFAFLGADQIAPYYHVAPGVPGVAPLTEEYLREDVAAAAAQADVVIVLPQWGVEYTHDPTFSQQSLAAAAIEAGADLVIGNHPHWVQAVDVTDDGAFIAYALGNFVFDQDWSVPTQQGVVLEAAFHGPDLKGVRLHPIRIVDEHQPVFAEPAEAQQILDDIWGASQRLP